MKIKGLRPGMENIDLNVTVLNLKEPKQVTTYTGLEHVLVEGEVEDDTGKAILTVWNERIDQLDGIVIGSTVELKNCFISSFKGVIHVNVGRDSEIIKKDLE
jgi:ssDNA-binding replication factor A large subunit